MADTTVLTAIWMVAVLQLGLQAGIVTSAYRLTRLTGSFRAWTMIILAFMLTAASSLMGVFYLLNSPDQIASIISSISPLQLVFSYAISITTSLLLFFGIFDLTKRFKAAAKAP